ncbi:hypothetical protein [Tessaracoccus flavus]|uniref:hypothetical protein n=1 Tax=Tessaracoccus flavus TaxID=1610493 RepID=UPI00115FECF6|nr:hypothetical protein [Tessaracoccus flavus]
MRTVTLAAVLPVLALVAACSPGPEVTPTPPASVAAPSSAPVEPAPSSAAAPSTSAVPAPSETVDPSTVEPSGELAPTGSLSPVPQPTPQGGPWTTVGETYSDAAAVAGASLLPESFRAFLGQRLGVEDEAGCTMTEVEVKTVHRDGFVFGSEAGTCGSAQTVWGITEGAWHYIVAFQDVMPCRDLELNGIPTGAEGLRCMDDSGAAKDY